MVTSSAARWSCRSRCEASFYRTLLRAKQKNAAQMKRSIFGLSSKLSSNINRIGKSPMVVED